MKKFKVRNPFGMEAVLDRIGRSIQIAENAARKGGVSRVRSERDAARKQLIVNSGGSREPMSEREFVRAFGTKAVRVRYSKRSDFVGLMVMGNHSGILVTGSEDNNGKITRKVRCVEMKDNLHYAVTKRYLKVKDHESVSMLQKGMLTWVR